VSSVIESITRMHVNVLLGDYGGIREYKARQINNYEPKPALELKPYQKLMIAILMDAIETLKLDPHDHGRKAHAWSSANRWLSSNDESYVLSFIPICEVFGWSPSFVRKAIARHLKAFKLLPKPPPRVNWRRAQNAQSGTKTR